MRNVRKQLAQAAQQYDVEIWQSEWSMLGDGYSSSEFIGYDQATEMDIALYMSKVIHNDLTIAGVSSWSYWTSMDIPRWGHKNRFLLISLEPAMNCRMHSAAARHTKNSGASLIRVQALAKSAFSGASGTSHDPSSRCARTRCTLS